MIDAGRMGGRGRSGLELAMADQDHGKDSGKKPNRVNLLTIR